MMMKHILSRVPGEQVPPGLSSRFPGSSALGRPPELSPGETHLKTLVNSLRAAAVSGPVACGLLTFGLMIPVAGCGSTEVGIAPESPPLVPPAVPDGQK